ncbi:MAG: hypothetical protein WB950_16565, partial [Acidobacteriaceae bacterium]
MLLLTIVFLGTLLTSFVLALWVTRRTRSEKAVQQRVGDIHLARQADKNRQLDAERILKLDQPGKFQWIDTLVGRFQFSGKIKTLLLQAGSGWTIGSLVIYSGVAGMLT